LVQRQLHTPAYLLRRRIVLHYLARRRPERLLEVGCGRGELLVHLASRGWEGIGLEIAGEAAATARVRLAEMGKRFQVLESPSDIHETFPLVLALEVLEHVEDERARLAEWREWLMPGGLLLITVPAHMRYWTDADEFGGHLRRYERDELRQLLTDSGFVIETFWSFGFPLTAVTVPLRRLLYRRRLQLVDPLSREDRVLRSSFDSIRPSRSPVAPMAVEFLSILFHWLQLGFLRTDLGASYLVACRRLG
jgi:SAM-dependent methyltransferase